MEKEIKPKNYFILLGMILITFVISFYVFSWLKQYNDAKLGNPTIISVIAEAKYDNLDSLLKERNLVVLYMCTTSEKVCRDFEVDLKKYIIEKNLSDEIVYFNLGDKQVDDEILNKIYNKYKHEDLIKKLNKYPSLLILSEGKIIDLLSPNKDNKLTISAVDEFLEGYELIHD